VAAWVRCLGRHASYNTVLLWVLLAQDPLATTQASIAAAVAGLRLHVLLGPVLCNERKNNDLCFLSILRHVLD
jgi:hypothetical protein